MDSPMQNSEAETEDGIPHENLYLQEPSDSRTVVNSVETVHPNLEAVDN